MTINQIANQSFAYRNLAVNRTAAAKSINKLSSGYRINSAANDAAGLAISEKMRSQVRGLNQASVNAQNGISMVQTAEGSLDSTSSILQRMRELSVQASNGTYSDSDRALLDQEFQALTGELDRISGATHYNGINLLDGSLGGTTGADGLTQMGIDSIDVGGAMSYDGTGKFTIAEDGGTYSITAQINGETITNTLSAGDTDTMFTLSDGTEVTLNFSGGVSSLSEGVIANVGIESGNVSADVSKSISADANSELYLHIGASSNEELAYSINDMSSFGLGLNGLSIGTAAGAKDALSAIDSAINTVSSQRAGLGAIQNRLEHTVSNLNVSAENLTAAESRIRDLDMAKELMNFAQRSLQMKASQAMMAQGMNLGRQYMMGLLLK